MAVDEVLTLDKAYKKAVNGLRELGWKDLELDSKKKGNNASFESSKDIWEILLGFDSHESYEVRSRSSWKIQSDASDIAQHLVDKINQGNPEHDFKMNDDGSFEVKTMSSIMQKEIFMDNIKKSMLNNIHAYESYVEMMKRFVNVESKHLEKETEGFRALMDTEFSPIANNDEQYIRLNLQK